MSQNLELSPEERIAHALMEAADAATEGVDYQRAFCQIPMAERPRVEALFNDLKDQTSCLSEPPAFLSEPPRKIRKLVEELGLEEGYIDAVETQRFYGLLKFGQNVPDFRAVTRVFTPDMLVAAQMFSEPKLVLTTKGRTFHELIDAIDASRTFSRQRRTHLHGAFAVSDDSRQKHWGAHIVDGASYPRVIGFHDDTDLSYGRRLAKFSRFKRANDICGMDRTKMAHFLMQDLMQGKGLIKTTLLDDDPAAKASRVPTVNWHNYYVQELSFADYSRSCERGRFTCLRASVGGNVADT